MSSVTVTELARHFAEYVNRVAYRRETFTLVRGGKEVAELRPVTAGVPVAELPALLNSLPRLSRSEADEFAVDVERARAELSEARDAWES